MDNREIDVAIAKKVMRWKEHFHRPKLNAWWIDENGKKYLKQFSPSSNIADAWKVVEKMENTHQFSLHRTFKENGWQVIFWDIETDAHRSLIAETASLAICLAALRCKGIDGSN